ncbi:MAG: sigma-54-dependent Fis family transcriptional regulator [Sphingomonadales bacterium]|jgi:sigma-54 specific flagellar transcriptional regulator A|nr:sigma-54-dependent Fis family transcriptional regulator [Sphingomonadales bacterium]MBP7135440.1 sigma-54-dependent Fis family transcriptional regulator [Sphingomonadaceae bacterium]MBK6492847.1 sigma-54-dependent Fis family transcriptional regulator [Sphingomonadales bacterium]MBK6720282.1 sigma-54-dependent Fis family transcriptional regulator [Sphingomonadales bacterium]MBK8272899.1 sigma-54-dependent Fis family transcriptional regulator [Sphingomonadales bacterium]
MAVAEKLQQVSNEARHLIVGQSPAIDLLRDMISRVAKASVPILLNGPSGSGKEMVARSIHAMSDRADKPFVAINCGAIPVDLIESELFGHEKGSFTGAAMRRIGRFEEADGGTLFLDEIGDMRFDMQVKLLRVLEEGIITRVGGNGTIPVNVRIISATHQNLSAAIDEGRFREDLYFRLGVIPVEVPSLASRAEDVPLLINHFQTNAPLAGRARFDPSALSRLMEHDWPGNVRELRNVVERAGILYPGEMIGAREAEQLLGRAPKRLSQPKPALQLVEAQPESIAPSAAPMPVDLKMLLETMELERIQMALDNADGVISEAARLLTLKRTTLIEKMRKYGVDRTC